MPTRRSYGLLTALGFVAQVAYGQLATDCNPTVNSSCPVKKGWPTNNYYVDFTKVSSLPKEWTLANYEYVNFGPKGAEFTFDKRRDAPNIWTDFYILGGRYDVEMQLAPGQGIITSSVLWSDSLDEIDWEFSGNAFGTQPFPPANGMWTVETNVFGQGKCGGGTYQPWVLNPTTTTHTYSVEWDLNYVRWYVDGVLKREFDPSQLPKGQLMPQAPMKLQLGVWDGGDPDNGYWVKQWAGGETDLAGGPYTAYIKSVNITNKYPACGFRFTDKTGLRNSVQIIKDGCDSPVSGSSSSAKPTPTQGPINDKKAVSNAAAAPTQTAQTQSTQQDTPLASNTAESQTTQASSPVSANTGISQSTTNSPTSSSTGNFQTTQQSTPATSKTSSSSQTVIGSSTARALTGADANPTSSGGILSSLSSYILGTTSSKLAATTTSAAPSSASSSPSSHASGSSTPVAGSSGSVSGSHVLVTTSSISTIFSTNIYTITSCAPTITNCPAKIGSVTTELVSIATTVCPVTKSLPAHEIAQSSLSLVSSSSPSVHSSAPSTSPKASSSRAVSSSIPPSASSSPSRSSASAPASSSSQKPLQSSSVAAVSLSGQPSSSAVPLQTLPTSYKSSSDVTTSSISTVYSTNIYTITSCAPTVTNCPARIGSVTTEIKSLYTTVCPVTNKVIDGTTYSHLSPSSAPQPSSHASSSAPSSQVQGKTSTAIGSSAPALSSSAPAPSSEPVLGTMSSVIPLMTTSTVYTSSIYSTQGTVTTELVALYTTICPVAQSEKERSSAAPASSVAYQSSSAAAVGSAAPSSSRAQVYSSAAAPSSAPASVESSSAAPSSRPASSQPPSYMTSTVYSTNVYTVTSCAPGVTNCPARETPQVTTEVIAVSTTVCPVKASESKQPSSSPASVPTHTQVVTLSNMIGTSVMVTTTSITYVDTPKPTTSTSATLAESQPAHSQGPDAATTLTLGDHFTTIIQYSTLTMTPTQAAPVGDVSSYYYSQDSSIAAMTTPAAGPSSPLPGHTTTLSSTVTNVHTVTLSSPRSSVLAQPATQGQGQVLHESSQQEISVCEDKTVYITVTPDPITVTTTVQPPFPSVYGSGTIGTIGGTGYVGTVTEYATVSQDAPERRWFRRA